jgi:drug/metabolite transporter (DMT)-like permease
MNELKNLALSGIFLAILAHSLVGLSLVWDKILLQRRETQNLLSYVFWLGAISVFGLILIAFGFRMPSLKIAGLAFAAGLLDLIASYFYYAALKEGEASDELAAMGGFAPVATALFALWLLKTPTGGEWLGFFLLTAGGFLMFFAERVPLRRVAPLIVLAATGFGLMNVLQKVVFDATNFVSGFVFFTLGTFAGSMALLIPRSWRKQIFEYSEKAPPKSKFWYMVNRFLAGVGSFLGVFAISRAHPSVVQAISGVRYVIIFLGAYLITRCRPSWFRENFSGRAMVLKAAGTGLVVAGLILVAMHGGGAPVTGQ